MPPLATGYDRDDETAEGDTMDKVSYCDTMLFKYDYNRLYQLKRLSNLNLFGECVRFILDIRGNDTCTPKKGY